ncbi:MAG: CPBP family intramembrane metalloprotease [Alistipes sp.]|nr:CPBP family intramembrane metalloprotease [Candidatus Minthomonas equi]
MRTKTSSTVKAGILAFLKSIIAIIFYAVAMAGVGAGIDYLTDGVLSFPVSQGICTLVAGLGSVWLMRRLLDHKPMSALGYAWDGRGFVRGFLLGTCLILVGLGILLLTASVRIVSFSPDISIVLQAVFLFVCVAVGEESCFRGYIVGNMGDTMGNVSALFISGILFSAPHLINPDSSVMSFMGILLAGWMLAAAYVFTRNLWKAIGIHLGWNLMQSMVGFRVSGLDIPGVLILDYPQENIWNGGIFGFEASLVCVILLSVVTAVLMWKERRNL